MVQDGGEELVVLRQEKVGSSGHCLWELHHCLADSKQMTLEGI